MAKRRTISVISLGCPKNLVDTEYFLGDLLRAGYEITPNLTEAEVIIVNTCAFISKASSESVEALLQTAELKVKGNCRLLVAAGCLPQKARRRLVSLIPEIDLVVGVHSYNRLPELIELSIKNRVRLTALQAPRPDAMYQGERFLTGPAYSVYIKISEGCDNRCAYCTIPRLRGPHRSRPFGSIVNEARILAGKGAREIILVAQDTTLYGTDTGDKSSLPRLLNEISDIKGIEWIRLLYAHPAHLDMETMETIALNPKVCPYIDLPLQHVNNRILRNMGRPYRKRQVIDLLDRLQRYDLTVRTTYMVGFPGEGEEEFKELLTFMKRHPIDSVGAFEYSPEKGTRAFSLKGRLAPAVKKARYQKLMETQQKISLNLNRRFLGRTLDVLVEGKKNIKGKEYFQGRSSRQAPGIDGVVLFTSKSEPRPGQMVMVRINSCGSYDLVGEEEIKNF